MVFRTIIIVAIVFSVVWITLDNFTGGKLIGRYEKTLNKRQTTLDDEVENLDEESFSVDKVSLSGREVIIESDIRIFLDNPILGIGVGMSSKEREKYIGFSAPPHTEVTRVLAEHGMFGVVALILYFFAPLKRFFEDISIGSKMFLLGFVIFSIITSFHSATRIAITVFPYALGFIIYNPSKKETTFKL
jgi:O-antigen ligase